MNIQHSGPVSNIHIPLKLLEEMFFFCLLKNPCVYYIKISRKKYETKEVLSKMSASREFGIQVSVEVAN